ncbi:RING finger protein 10 [Octopus sinensis]|uniref:E3 ubiquitin-protein ligase RNF10 n=1 Tax=Octopus sinensis TaxID=2607531 RepID=A0A6P7TW70_9MOLL|nr:RING finger protein 10 [Octopus sinensis]
MLEEGRTMDKKIVNRNSPVPVKTNPGERKSDPVRFQRNNKKKENGSRPYQDVNPYKKPLPQRTRSASDKRPRIRGNFNDKPRNEVAEQLEAEYDSILNENDISHMINFDYGTRRTRSVVHHHHHHHHVLRRPRYMASIFNKQQYLQANCQFVVKDSGDYSIHATDPDKPLDWDSIEQVRMSSPELPLCPICLSRPMAGKITKCGHIYCWSCILHYLALSEKKWHRCPICNEPVYQKDLKSVKTTEVTRYKTGDKICLTLMRREKGSTMPVAKASWQGPPSKPCNVKETKKACFSKVLLASTTDVQELVTDIEDKELMLQMSNAEESEVCFIESAIEQQKMRIANLSQPPTGDDAQEGLPTSFGYLKLDDAPAKETLQASSKAITKYLDAFDEEVSSDLGPAACLPDDSSQPESPNPPHLLPAPVSPPHNLYAGCTASNLTQVEHMPTEVAAESLELPHHSEDKVEQRRGISANTSKDTFYFYQAADGQHIYLHAVNARCLAWQYGSLENSPETITASIVEVESIAMTQELRNRLRYLNHLPLSVEFKVVELLLNPPVVSKETLKEFSDIIKKRVKCRQKKQRQERLRSKLIEEENRKYRPCPVRIVMSSADEIQYERPQLSFPQLIVPSDTVTPPPVNVDVTLDCTDPTPSQSEHLDSGKGKQKKKKKQEAPLSPPAAEVNQASFAQKLKSGKVRKNKVTVGPSPAGASSSSLQPGFPLRSSKYGSDSEISDPDVGVPNYKNSFGASLDNLGHNDGSRPKGGKKKKMKMLFSTTMARVDF